MRHALATGNWGVSPKGDVVRHGVSQALSRITFMSTLSHLKRINTPLSKSGKLSKPRHLHNTHWGVICPAETPEGQSCGLVKNMSLISTVSVGKESQQIENFLINQLDVETLESINPKDVPLKTKIFVNGKWIGLHSDAEFVISTLRDHRRRKNMP
jgi:DNA-directed RNA polymerase II subunit RPB2